MTLEQVQAAIANQGLDHVDQEANAIEMAPQKGSNIWWFLGRLDDGRWFVWDDSEPVDADRIALFDTEAEAQAEYAAGWQKTTCQREALWGAMAGYVESWPCTGGDDGDADTPDVTITFRGQDYALCLACKSDIQDQIQIRKRDGTWSEADAAEFEGIEG